MEIVVCVQRLLDSGVRLRVDEVAKSVVQDEPEPTYLMNPADRCALEAALKIAAADPGSNRVTAMTLGPLGDEGVLRYCLARGADGAIRIWDEAMEGIDPFLTATLLARALAKRKPDLILCGDRSSWGGTAQIPAILAELGAVPQLTHVVDLELVHSGKRIRVQRRMERGSRLIVEAPLPCVVAIVQGALPVRYVSRSSQRRVTDDIPCLALGDLDTNPAEIAVDQQRTKIVSITPPRPRTKKTAAPVAAGGNMMAMMMGGGSAVAGAAAKKTASGPLQGTPEKMAAEIARFLGEKGFLPGP